MKTNTKISFLARTARLARATGAKAAMTLLLLLVTSTSARADIVGFVDVVQGRNGSLEVNGWTYETGYEGDTVRVHVQIFDLEGHILNTVEIRADTHRDDVGNISFQGFIPLNPNFEYMVKFAALGKASSRYLTSSTTDTNTFYVSADAPWTISYNANGGYEALGAQENRWGIPSTLSTVQPTRRGYTFTGWNTAADGSGEGFPSGYTHPFFWWQRNMTLYAQWTPITYTITYDLADGSVATPNPTSYTVESDALTLVNPTRDGYIFTGWTGTNLSEPTMTVTIPKGSTGNRSYTATWKLVDYLAYNTATGEFETCLVPSTIRTVTSSTTTLGTAGTETWYVVANNVTFSSRIGVLGTVHLILCDGKTLTANYGIGMEKTSTLVIYGQSGGTGKLRASAASMNSIGLPQDQMGGTITIHGGTIESTTKNGSSSAIGGFGHYGGGATVTIYGGHVTARGTGEYGSGIGGSGYHGSGGTVHIQGGTVIVEAGANGHAIGGEINPGSLTLGDMKVYASASATTPVEWSSRVSTCRSTYAKLVPCTEHNMENGICTWCGMFITYDIAYDLAGGTVATPNPTTYSALSDAITLVNPTRDGYVFTGWTGTGLTEPTMTVTIPKGSAGNRAYTATWTAPIGSIDYVYSHNGSISFGGWAYEESNPSTPIPVQVQIWSGETLIKTVEFMANNPREDLGYDCGFTGVIPLDEGTYKVKIMAVGTTSVYLVWPGVGSDLYPKVGTPWTISYDANGGTGAPEPQTNHWAVPSTLSTVQPTRTGYTFTGWNTIADGSGVPYPSGYTDIYYVWMADRTLYAQWTPTEYTITYDLGEGGSVATPNPTSYTIESNAITLVNPTRYCYDFAGWTGTGLTEPTKAVTIPTGSTDNRSYTATWTPITYTVRFHKNDGNEDVYTDQTLTYNVEQPLTANAFTRNGYGFIGWAETADGAVTYADGQSVANLATEQDAVVNLYAKWTETYSIAYDLAGGSATTPNPTTYTALSEDITLVNPTRAGYTFTGWTGTDLAEPTMTVTIPTGSTGNRAYTATWTAIAYTITYDLAGGTVATDNPTGYTVQNEAITLVNPTRERYTFTGWTGTGLPGLTMTVTIPAGSMGNRSYTATWIPEEYYYAYNTTTGTFEEYLASSCIPVSNSTTTMGAANTETWYMVNSNVNSWGRIEVRGTVNLILNDGATLNASRGITVNSGNTLNIYGQTSGTGTLNATGVKVGGDGTESAAIGSTGSAGGTALGIITIHGGHITANGAGWSAGIGGGIRGGGGSVKIYGGTVNATGHDGTSEAIGCGSSGAAVSKALAKGLRVTVNNSSSPVAYSSRVSKLAQKVVKVEPCTAHTLNNNMCVYCGWTETYTIAYDLDGGTVDTPNPTTYTALSANITLVNPIRDGYVFAGWTGTDLAEPTMTVTIPNGSTGNRTFTATWTERYTIAYDLDGGSVATPNPTTYSALSGSITLVNPTRDGYVFTGWTGTELAEPTMTVTIPHGSEGNRAYTATWTESYSIAYDLDGGTVDTPNPTSYTVLSADITLVNPTRAGYAFAGWTGTGVEDPTMTVTIPHGSEGNRSYTATWTESYTITYNLGGGSVETPNPTTYSVLNGSITLVNPTRDGYTFVGWTGTGLTEPTMSVTITADDTGSRTYTANWIENVLALENAGDNGENISKAIDGKLYRVTLSERTFFRDGDWNTLCLPFNVDDFTGTPLEGATVKTLESTVFSDGILTMNFSDDQTSIQAGKPYIMKWTGSAYEADLMLRSAADWNTFAARVNNGTDDYQGKVVKLAADISVSTMVGDASHHFRGTFDGCGHTLNVDIGQWAKMFVAPFSAVDAATIQNLTVKGSVNSTASDKSGANHCSGLIGQTLSGTTNIISCDVQVAISTNSYFCGGFVGFVNGGVNVINSRFSGSIYGRDIYAGIFSGWNGTTQLFNSIAAGSYNCTGHLELSHSNINVGQNIVVRNCYKTLKVGSFGTYTTATGETLRSALGDGWEIRSDNVVPKMPNTAKELVSPVFSNVTIDNTTANVSTEYVDFIGTYSPVVYNDENRSVLFLGSGNNLYYPDGTKATTINACRAYFQLTNGLTAGDPNDPYSVKAFNLNLGEGVATEIRPTPTPSLNGGEWYDLSGRKLAGKPTKSGVYMNNGRKVAIK